MARVYVSSTFDDLQECRAVVLQALRRLGVDEVAMEDYTAGTPPPLDRCLADVRASDVYVGILAWRSGFVPPGQDRSIVELEYRAAVEAGKEIAMFLLDDDAPWPRRLVDRDLAQIERFRAEVLARHLCQFFTEPHELAALVMVSVGQLLLAPDRTLPAGRTGETTGLWTGRDALETQTARASGGPGGAPVDLFICHATEDKAAVARPLVEALGRRGRSVWYDDFELTLGDSLRQSIEAGLATARYGVVILSRSFFAKQWPRQELDALAARETAHGAKVILPVWHGVDHADVSRYSPLLSGRVAARSDDGIEAVVDQIERVLTARAGRKPAPPSPAPGYGLLPEATDRPVVLHETLPALVGAHPRTVELSFVTSVPGVQTLFDAGEPRSGEKFRIALADAACAPQAGERGPGLYVQLWDADLYVVHRGLTDGRRHHIAVAVDRQSAAITIDGQPVRAQVWDGAAYTPPLAAPYPLPLRPATAPAAVLVGAGQADGSRWARRFEGTIGGVRVLPTASPLIT